MSLLSGTCLRSAIHQCRFTSQNISRRSCEYLYGTWPPRTLILCPLRSWHFGASRMSLSRLPFNPKTANAQSNCVTSHLLNTKRVPLGNGEGMLPSSLCSKSRVDFRHPNSLKYGFAFIISGGVAFVLFSLLVCEGLMGPNSHACHCEENSKELIGNYHGKLPLNEAIEKARILICNVKEEYGIPGMAIGVTVDGKDVWQEGFGYSDVENHVRCTPDTVMRIASISKSITMTAVAKLMEKGLLDLDKPIQYYLPTFPEKTFKGEKVTVTTRQLVSHLGGIRHYDKPDTEDEAKIKVSSGIKKQGENRDKETGEKNVEQNKTTLKKSEFDHAEYFIQKHYDSVTESLEIFKNDPLVHKPGTKFLYTTHGWTLVSAVMEKAANQPFPKLIGGLFKDLGMEHTYLEFNNPLIYNRSRYYRRNSKGMLENVPYVDLSYKWAGGGFVSTVSDLTNFGNSMLYCYQYHPILPGESGLQPDGSKLVTGRDGKADSSQEDKTMLQTEKDVELESHKVDNKIKRSRNPGYLKSDAVTALWKPVDKTKSSMNGDGVYGMGWEIYPVNDEREFGLSRRYCFSHTGYAIGASSVLLILPGYLVLGHPPKGVVVAITVNLFNVDLKDTALEVAKLFGHVCI